MKRVWLAAAVLALASCKKKTEQGPVVLPVRAVVAGLEMIDYPEPSGAFTIIAPAHWQARETHDLGPEVMLLGPGTEKFPRSVDISISRYPNKVDTSTEPYHYYRNLNLMETYRNVSKYEKRVFGGHEVYYYSLERPLRQIHKRKVEYYLHEDNVIIPFEGGFYHLEHSAPVDIYKDTMPVFEAVVASFKPGPLPKAGTP